MIIIIKQIKYYNKMREHKYTTVQIVSDSSKKKFILSGPVLEDFVSDKDY